MPNPSSGCGHNRGNGGAQWHAPPVYTAQDNGAQTPLRYPNLAYNTVRYGAIDPSPNCCSSRPPGTQLKTVMFCIFVGIVIGYILQTPLDSWYLQSKQLEWEREKQYHQEEQKKWESWVSARDAEKQRWEEELAQKRSQIEWQGLQPHQCIRYGTREYKSTLSHVPLGINPMDECRSKTLHINGRDLYPSRCDDEGYCGKITGHWEVDFNEPQCTPFFAEVSDKGCNGGFRRYDARLENIQEWETWREVCSTMTAAYGSVRLGPGASCSECNGGRCGRWATWMVEDSRCR